MMVLVKSGSWQRTQVSSFDYDTEASQLLVDAAHDDDTNSAFECIANPLVDVNFVGTANLKSKTTEIVLRDESPHEVRFVHEEFKTEVTPLFLAAHNGNLTLLRNLLVKLLATATTLTNKIQISIFSSDFQSEIGSSAFTF